MIYMTISSVSERERENIKVKLVKTKKRKRKKSSKYSKSFLEILDVSGKYFNWSMWYLLANHNMHYTVSQCVEEPFFLPHFITHIHCSMKRYNQMILLVFLCIAVYSFITCKRDNEELLHDHLELVILVVV